MNVSTPSRLQDLHLPDMPDRPSIDLPDFEMPDIDVSKIDIPKAVTAAATTAATAVGLIKPSRPRWPYALGAAVLLAAGAVIAMNWTTVRARLQAAASMAGARIAEMRRSQETGEPVAFPAADTATQQPSETTGEVGAEYPDGLGKDGLGKNGSSVSDALDSEAYVGV
jgi:hypothetical protein